MFKKKTPKQIYDEYEIKLPNPILHAVLRVVAFIYRKTSNIKYVYHFDKNKYKDKQIILLSDHASFNSFYYVFAGFMFKRMNAVASFAQFFNKFIFTPFRWYGIIPKKNYEIDLKAMRQMIKVIKMGGSILLFPEGTFSYGGSAQPINPSTINFLKQMGVSVILCKTYGVYCKYPYFDRRDTNGYCEVHYEEMFSPEDLKQKSNEEIYEELLERFRYNDVKWSGSHHELVDNKAVRMDGLDKLIYICPKCHSKYKLAYNSGVMSCSECGNNIFITPNYEARAVTEKDVCPYKDINDWFIDERHFVREEVKDKDFNISYECNLYEMGLDKIYSNNKLKCGEGRVTINHNGVNYIGTKHDEKVDMMFQLEKIPCYKAEAHTRNFFFYHGTYYGFEPKENVNQILNNMIAVEEMHNQIDPVWDKAYRDVFDYKY